ncbi:MAG: hypothetical protein ACQUHE_06640 [Bacteroidia bacterium]
MFEEAKEDKSNFLNLYSQDELVNLSGINGCYYDNFTWEKSYFKSRKEHSFGLDVSFCTSLAGVISYTINVDDKLLTFNSLGKIFDNEAIFRKWFENMIRGANKGVYSTVKLIAPHYLSSFNVFQIHYLMAKYYFKMLPETQEVFDGLVAGYYPNIKNINGLLCNNEISEDEQYLRKGFWTQKGIGWVGSFNFNESLDFQKAIISGLPF